MRYLRLNAGDIRGIHVAIPVVFKVGDEEFTGLVDGTIDVATTKPLKDDQVEERER